MGHAAFYRYVKSKLHSFPAGSPLYGASQEFERCNKESEVFMRKRIITLLLGLMAATALLTVTAWATEPKPEADDVCKLIGTITLQCTHNPQHISKPNPALGYTGRDFPFSVGEPTYNEDHTICSYDLTIPAKRFVDFWDNNKNPDDDDYYDFHHWKIDTPTAEFKLIYSYASKEWSLADITTGEPLSKPDITFRVSCAKPTLPTAAEVAAMLLPNVRISNRSTPSYEEIPMTTDLYDMSRLPVENYYWDSTDKTWCYKIPLNDSKIIAMYDQKTGKNSMLFSNGEGSLILKYNLSVTPNAWFAESVIPVDIIPAPSMDLLKSLGVTTVSVSCQGSTHDAKSFALTSFSQLSGSWVYIETSHQYEYRLTLTNAAVNDYLAQYSTAVDKTHTLDSSGYVALTWYQPGGVVVYANTDPVEAEPEEKWVLVGDDTFNITAACVPDTPQDNTTTTTRPRRKPAAAPVQADDTTISSAKTYDGGIALYAGLTLLSTTGAALLHRKKDN